MKSRFIVPVRCLDNEFLLLFPDGVVGVSGSSSSSVSPGKDAGGGSTSTRESPGDVGSAFIGTVGEADEGEGTAWLRNVE